jgi:hypothetical protein
VRWLATGLGFLCRVALVGWVTLAIYYSNLPWAWSRTAFGTWALWLSRRPRMLFALAGVFLAVSFV